MLASPPMEFGDVRDPAAFVHTNINKWCRPTSTRGAIVLSTEEHEELHAEGMAIMCKLAAEFEPHRDGYAQAGRFSGYAAMYLPRKLGDAWHRLHEEHQLRTGPDGSRGWHYGDAAVSLEALCGDDGEDRGSHLTAREQEERSTPTIEKLLREQLEERLDAAVRVAGLLGEGVTSDRDIAGVLGLTTDQVRFARDDLQPVVARLETLNQR